MFTKIERILGRSIEFLATIGGIFLVVLVLINTYAVVRRYLFNSPIEWSMSLSCILMVACVFFCAAHTLERGAHVAVDILVNKFSSRNRAILTAIKYGVILIFMCILTWHSWFLAWSHLHTTTDSIEKMPLFPAYITIPIGSGMVCFYVVLKIFELLLNYRNSVELRKK